MGSGIKPQLTNDLVLDGVKETCYGGSNHFPKNECNFTEGTIGATTGGSGGGPTKYLGRGPLKVSIRGTENNTIKLEHEK